VKVTFHYNAVKRHSGAFKEVKKHHFLSFRQIQQLLDTGSGLPRTGYGIRYDFFGIFYETAKDKSLDTYREINMIQIIIDDSVEL
ncbi:MAG: hypothetical protein J7J07_03065, partial [Syntrophobacterales bacterium]|nr:hypothetical protein [Syntrophobacterales bacterium]